MNSQPELSADNFTAAIESDKRDWAELDRLLRKHGVCNVIGIAADLVGDMAGEHEEGSEADEDYSFAHQVLDAAARAVDLTYGRGTMPHREARAKAVDSIIKLAQTVRGQAASINAMRRIPDGM